MSQEYNFDIFALTFHQIMLSIVFFMEYFHLSVIILASYYNLLINCGSSGAACPRLSPGGDLTRHQQHPQTTTAIK